MPCPSTLPGRKSCAPADHRPIGRRYGPRAPVAPQYSCQRNTFVTISRQFCEAASASRGAQIRERRALPARRLLLDLRRLAAGARQPHGEGAPAAGGGGDVELAFVAVEDVLDDGEPEPGAALVAARGDVDAVETLGQ